MRSRRPYVYQPVVPCAYCGKDTTFTGTRTCHDCWEVVTRMRAWPWGRLLRVLWAKLRGGL